MRGSLPASVRRSCCGPIRPRANLYANGVVASSFFSSTSNPCGNTVRVTNAASGDDVTATVTDSCGGLNCLSDDDIALSQDALNALGDSSGFPIRGAFSSL